MISSSCGIGLFLSGRGWFAPFSAGCGGTDGVAVSTPQSPAEKQEADFRPGEPGAQRRGVSCHRADKCRRCRPGAAGAGRIGRRERRTGEPAGRGLTATGSLAVKLGPR
ncbi:hypothetical protein MCNS_18690 [Mycobacterium conspicuum]|uniref:Uncharacterized protein n=1 Tax=Mycobacterium conspicuum TaxID=44010 RepID=A0A7I7YAT0_9MYCO|nr:hypothetical protein MCNS_18690 [Mycobacterium conspicuum]